jgi:hypothetical protein
MKQFKVLTPYLKEFPQGSILTEKADGFFFPNAGYVGLSADCIQRNPDWFEEMDGIEPAEDWPAKYRDLQIQAVSKNAGLIRALREIWAKADNCSDGEDCYFEVMEVASKAQNEFRLNEAPEPQPFSPERDDLLARIKTIEADRKQVIDKAEKLEREVERLESECKNYRNSIWSLLRSWHDYTIANVTSRIHELQRVYYLYGDE